MNNVFLVMLANQGDIRSYVAEEGYALFPAVMEMCENSESLGAASKTIKKLIFEAKKASDDFRGVAICSPLFPFLCEIKYSRSQEDWDMLMELHKNAILDMLDGFGDAKIKIVEHDDVMAATLVQLAQEFGIDLV